MSSLEENLMNAKYHLRIAEQTYESYRKFSEKSLINATINELFISVFHILKIISKLEKTAIKNPLKNQRKLKKILSRHFSKEISENLIKILNIKCSIKNSHIEFKKKETIVLLISGEYKFLKVERLKDFQNSINNSLKTLSQEIRQI